MRPLSPQLPAHAKFARFFEVSNWFVSGRGQALGLANIPLGNAMLPVAAAAALSAMGLSLTFLAGAILLLLLLPLLLLLTERPDAIGQVARGAVATDTETPAGATMTTRQIFSNPGFLVLSLTVGVLSASGLVIVTQLVGLSMERGLSLETASLVLAAFGLAGAAGAPLFGVLADRLGGGRAFGVLAFALVPGWLGLLVADSFVALLLLATVIGICSNGIVTLFGATMSDWLGAPNVGMAMGLCYLLQIPFLFGAAPLAGAMYEATGGYGATIMLHVASMVAIGLLMFLFRPTDGGIRTFRPASM